MPAGVGSSVSIALPALLTEITPALTSGSGVPPAAIVLCDEDDLPGPGRVTASRHVPLTAL